MREYKGQKGESHLDQLVGRRTKNREQKVLLLHDVQSVGPQVSAATIHTTQLESRVCFACENNHALTTTLGADCLLQLIGRRHSASVLLTGPPGGGVCVEYYCLTHVFVANKQTTTQSLTVRAVLWCRR